MAEMPDPLKAGLLNAATAGKPMPYSRDDPGVAC